MPPTISKAEAKRFGIPSTHRELADHLGYHHGYSRQGTSMTPQQARSTHSKEHAGGGLGRYMKHTHTQEGPTISKLLQSVIANAQTVAQTPPPAQKPAGPNRVYIGQYHSLPPGARKHVGADGRAYYIPDETPSSQSLMPDTKPEISPAEQSEYAERYAQVVAALKARLEQYTHEIQQHLQEANTSPVDPTHLHDLNAKVQQIQAELQDAQANLDQYQQAEGG